MSGKKVYIALTAGQGCLWGAGISEDAGKEGLGQADGEFKEEAKEISPSYTWHGHGLRFSPPKSPNAGGL